MATDVGFHTTSVSGIFCAESSSIKHDLRRANERRERFACLKGGVGCQHFPPRQPGRSFFRSN